MVDKCKVLYSQYMTMIHNLKNMILAQIPISNKNCTIIKQCLVIVYVVKYDANVQSHYALSTVCANGSRHMTMICIMNGS